MAGANKERIDILLVEKGFAQSRERAKSMLMAGLVFLDNQRIDKPGMKIPVDSHIEVKGNTNPYVSRGGLKLDKALKKFDIPVQGRVYMDIGASTGGFTDCLLKNGAKTVIAIDVGYEQFAWELRNDNRVILMERTNIRNVTRNDLGMTVNGAVIDVSFISLKLVLPVVLELLSEDSHIAALIKPQFEAGKDRVGKHGVVRDASVHIDVLTDIILFANEIGFEVENLDYSPIKGPEGNIEFLCHLYKGSSDITKESINNSNALTAEKKYDIEKMAADIVKAAHMDLWND